MSDLKNQFVSTAVAAFNDGYIQGWSEERERIIRAMRNEETAKTLMFLARNTQKDYPKVIQDHAWSRIAEVIRGEKDE
jgi:hypothetical protein